MVTTVAALNKLKEREKTLAMADIRPITEDERKVIINNAMNDEKIGDKALEVLKYIEYLSRNYGVAWPSNIYLSEKLSFSSRSISRYIAVLVATGYVVRNFVYRNGKIFVRTLALNYKKAKEVVKVNILKWADIMTGVKISKKQFFAYLKNTKSDEEEGVKIIENNTCDGFKNDADDCFQNSFWHAGGEQVGVSNIYNLNKLMKSEIDCEIRMTFPNDKIIEFYEYAKLQEKTIFLISDMYLTKDVIENMLKKCNIKDYNKLYVSCEYNCNKLTGKLFEKVAAENGIKLNQMVHFGDSIKADYLGAKKVGLHCYITPQKNRFVRLLGRIK